MVRPFAFLLPFLVVCVLAIGPAPASAVCGDGALDGDEQCDGGACCSGTCRFEPAGAACADDGQFCTRDRCDGAGACVHDASPLESCLVAPKGKLQIVDDADDTKDKLTLQLQNAPGVSPADFGDPTATDTYHACIFGPEGLLMQAEVAPGGSCGGKPCWAETTTGFTYKDKTGTRDGITALKLKASAKPKTKIDAKGKGPGLDVPALPFPEFVMAQIVNAQTGQCFETHFLEPSAVKKNTATQFDARAAAPGYEVPGLAKVIRQDKLDAATPSIVEHGDSGPAPDPTQVFVRAVTYAGSGCPEGSVSELLSDDRTILSLAFDQLVASKGPGAAGSDAAKACQVNLDLAIPAGWQYTIARFDHRGVLALPKKTRAIQRATYYFEGEGELATADSTFVGPQAREYLIRDTLPFSTVVWSSCEKTRPLAVTTELEVKGTEAGSISGATLDHRLDFVLGLQWRQCP